MKGLGRVVERALTPAPMPMATGVANAGGAGGGTYGPWGGVPAVPGRDNHAMLQRTPGESTTLGLSAAWRCSHILADGIGALQIYAYDDRENDARLPTPPRILSDPWPMVTPVEWRSMVVMSLVMHGDAFLLPYDMDPRTGYPRQLIIVHPDDVHMSIRDGRPIYKLFGQDGREVDCLHIRGLMMPGQMRGVGIVESQRLGIQLALDIDGYQTNNFRQSSVPPVVVKVNRPEISEEQAIDIQQRWVTKHGYGNRAPAVIPTSMDVQTIAWSPEDTQFLESKQFMAAEVCWWFGVDPRLLGLSASGESLTYSNLESTYVDLQRMSFMPWTSRIESALSRVLPRHTMARFDFSPILRTTLQDRYSAYKTGIEGGWLTIDEVRALENLGPIEQAEGGNLVGSSTGSIESMRNQSNDSLPTTSTEVL